MKLAAWRPWRPVSVVVSPGVEPGIVNKADVVAIKALSSGEASPDQQKRALEAIVARISCADDMSFRADDHGGTRETDFAEGKRYVGLQVRKFVNTPLHILTGEKTSQG